MKSMSVVCMFCLISISFQASNTETESAIHVEKLNWLLEADPIADLELALSQSDERFIGIYGFGRKVPLAEFLCIDLKRDVKFIEGTSDARSGYEHAKLNKIAEVYAQSTMHL